MTPGRRLSDCIVRTPDVAAGVGCHTKITELCLLNLAGNGVQQNLLCSVLGYGYGLCLKTGAARDRTKTICEGRFTNRPYTSLAPQNRQTAIPKISPASHQSELGIVDLAFAAVMTQLTCRFNDVVQASDMRF